jgi:hypothetical protein
MDKMANPLEYMGTCIRRVEVLPNQGANPGDKPCEISGFQNGGMFLYKERVMT